MKWAVFLRRAVAAVGGLAASVVVAETGARVVSPMPGESLYYGGPVPPPTGMYQWSSTTGKEPVPGYTGELVALDLRVPIRFNSLGTRGAEPDPGPAWLAIGDSFTLGLQVPEDATWQALLAPRVGAQVLNAGVDAYSTLQAARRYVGLADARDVDTVLLTFYLGNDFVDNERALSVLATPAQDYTRAPPGVHSDRWLTLLHANSAVAAYIHVARNRARSLGSDDPANVRFREDLALWSYRGRPRLDALLRPTADQLTELRDAARARGDRVIVALAPPSYAVDPDALERLLADYDLPSVGSDAPVTTMLALLDTLGIPACDLTPALTDAERRGTRTYLRFDGHWSRAGHAVVAEALGECVRALP